MNPNVPMFLDARARARAAGDRGLERAIQADLDRLGYIEPETPGTGTSEPDPEAPVRVETATGMETTAVRVQPKPFAKGGRPPKRRAR